MNRMINPIIIAPPPPPISLTPPPSRANKPPAKNTKLIGKNNNRNPSNGTGSFRKYNNPQKKGTKTKKNAASPITEINAAEILAPIWPSQLLTLASEIFVKDGSFLSAVVNATSSKPLSKSSARPKISISRCCKKCIIALEKRGFLSSRSTITFLYKIKRCGNPAIALAVTITTGKHHAWLL